MKRTISKIMLTVLVTTVAAPAQAGFTLSKENTTKLVLATGLAALAGGSFYDANQKMRKTKKITVTPLFLVSIIGLLALINK